MEPVSDPLGDSPDLALVVGGESVVERDEAIGLRPFLARVAREGGRVAFVSRAPLPPLESVLRGTDLPTDRTATVSRGEVGQGPPAPDLFVEAARRLGAEPWRCVALVEPGTWGEAARRAGCQILTLATAEEPASDSASVSAGEPRVESLARLSPARLHNLFFSPSKTLYCEVAVDLPVRRTYTYRVPAWLRATIRVGSMVRIPVVGRRTSGVVTRLSVFTEIPKRKIKSIERILTPEYWIAPDLLSLGGWMTEYYLGGPGETLSAIAFFGLHDETPRTERRLCLADPARWQDVPLDSDEERARRGLPDVTPRQREVVRFFLEELNEPIARSDLTRREGCSAGVIDILLRKGVLSERLASVERGDAYASPQPGEPAQRPLLLTPEQQSAFEPIRRAVESRRFETFLLDGITGSGKTEIYLQAIARALELRRQAIVLVPEISLTPQAVDRFRKRFGSRVGVYHSQLSRGQKYDLWRRIASGEVHILIGARSAVFAPFPNLGLIVVDEEHEHSYKQSDPAPRYHARDVAIWRARFARTPAVLGSATPSLESLFQAREGKFTRLRLANRVGGASLPDVRLIDMGAHVRDDRHTGSVSAPLREAIERRLERGEQSILFLNRRGFSNFVLCLACKTPIRCDHCDVATTWHKSIGKMMCHLCGDTKERPARCPHCEAPDPTPIGMGTQRIEEEVGALFPDARLLRIDLDTTRGKHGFLRLWERIEAGEADILLGTQMIAKGLHLERVTLVGVISADHALFLPDFRAAERAFAQLTQVAGRAGRMRQRGEVIVQTFVPQHYAIQRAVAHDSEGFRQQEFHMREMLRFPPHCRLLLARFKGANPRKVADRAARLGRLLRDAMARADEYRSLTVLGPAPSPIGRIQDETRWQILLRGTSPSLMRRLLSDALAVYEKDKGRAGVTLTLDMDPLDLL
ncbi:primosomal protein N' [Candidatus Sumerlaeota bacterium]|nr:primosomal protein N' [Candidatus Sumerlaeota bacterium]